MDLSLLFEKSLQLELSQLYINNKFALNNAFGSSTNFFSAFISLV